MRKNGVNPYLPSWEYVPDGEPYVFGDRVYVYGSHDRWNGYAFCLNDYVCWSAPKDDLADWRYEGMIYRKTDDPMNRDGEMCLYAPDVAKGPDGRYYLYYVLDQLSIMSVAVSDSPVGPYVYYGTVHYPDGTYLGQKEGDQPQFDPGILVEGENVYLYSGFSPRNNKSRNGAQAIVLEPDMITVKEAPRFIVPSGSYSAGTGYEGHEFFEASSIRKIKDIYYFVYSSILCHELCYATSKEPTRGFVFGGTIVSNNDIGISEGKPAQMPTYYGGNNHGSIIEIEGQWYVFYHRHTNGTNYSRQGCIEPIQIEKDGRIPQVRMTSCGPNNGPLPGNGEYPGYIACSLFCRDEEAYTAKPGEWMDCRFPKIMQDGRDGDEEPGYIANMRDGAIAGFKYFDCHGVTRIAVTVRGAAPGAQIEVLTAWDGDVCGSIPVKKSNEWKTYEAEVKIPDGVQEIWLRYAGLRAASLKSFRLISELN